jgi:outer membrane protein assembly factor BamB
MNKKHSYNKMVILGVIFLLLLVPSFLNIGFCAFSNYPQTLDVTLDEDDGFWIIDEFEEGINVALTNCDITDSGSIILSSDESSGQSYDYSNYQSGSLSKAYYYVTYFFNKFFPPEFHIPIYETEIGRFWEKSNYELIGKNDNNFFPDHDSSDMFKEDSKLKKVHHFRFKIDETISKHTSRIDVNWHGYAKNDSYVSMYCWQPSNTIVYVGSWKPLMLKKSDGENIELFYGQPDNSDNSYIQYNNYIDVCIIANPQGGKKCNLFSDYVKITAYGGYSEAGRARTIPISTKNISSWELFTWEDNEKSETDITYHIYYNDIGPHYEKVEEKYLEGNENGFSSDISSPPIFLNKIPSNYTLKIEANLETHNKSISPEIISLGITWQTKENTWKDLFNSTLRVDRKSDDTYNVRFKDGNVSLTVYSNDWSTFGKNSENTRSSDGYGPGLSSASYDAFWKSIRKSGTWYRNPVIKSGILYIASKDGKEIYSYDAYIGDSGDKPNNYLGVGTIPANVVNCSPAVMDEGKDEIVIVATSSKDVENKIYAFNRNDLSAPIKWTFSYPGNSNIRYCSSPVIYDSKIFITSCGETNKIFALDSNGKLQSNLNIDLPAGSLSSPALHNDKIVVGCANKDGKSLFVFDLNGNEIWSKNVGAIGRASPIIYNNKIFVLVREPIDKISFVDYSYTKLISLDLENGEVLWTSNITSYPSLPNKNEFAACSTPTIHDDLIFVASPNWKLYAFNIEDGKLTNKWNSNPINLYDIIHTSFKPLISSPAYADGAIYIGTPDGMMYAIKASNGEVIAEIPTLEVGTNIWSSPIVVDGLLFYSDENGNLYSAGKGPREMEGETKGEFVSIPIYLPQDEDNGANYYWDRFYANYGEFGGRLSFTLLDGEGKELKRNIANNVSIYEYAGNNTIKLQAEFTGNLSNRSVLYDWYVTFTNVTEDRITFFDNTFSYSGTPPKCEIEVMGKNSGINTSSAEYNLSYKNQTGEHSTLWVSANCSGDGISTSREKITADTSKLNFSENITEYSSIRFRIKNSSGGQWNSNWFEFEVEGKKDAASPIFYEDSFRPKDGWIATNTPTCTIDVKDMGTEGNITGLNISSAEYTLKYKIKNQSGTKTNTSAAQCSGNDGSTNKENISVDISELDFSENITELISIRFYIEDNAKPPNSNEFFFDEFKNDTEKPYSYINNTEDINYTINTTPVKITAVAEDNRSEIDHVTLYYRALADTSWSSFSSDDTSPYSWSFSVASGEYELCTIATDYAGNDEDYPADGDVSFIFDPNPPYLPSFDSEYRFDELPEFSIEFTDDYKLKSVEYRLNFNEANEWTKINDGDINSKSYAGNWNLTQDDWDYMIEEESYYMFFRLTDSLENQNITPSADEAMKIIKDLNRSTPPDPDLSDFEEWHWDNVFTVSVDITGENITNLQLHYSYSADNKTWTEWNQYGDNITTSPFEWNFIAKEGSGYYMFKTVVWDTSGNVATSQVKSVSVTLFPTIPIIIMMPLAVILILVTTFVLGFKPFKLKKKKT